MPIQRDCTLVAKRQVGPNTWQFTLEAGEMLTRTRKGPGQFLHIACGHSRLLRRPISVCACGEAEGAAFLSIVFEVRGEGTAWLARREVGDTLDVLGLLGNGFAVTPGGRYLLAGGGIGVPPLYGCAQFCGGKAVAVLGFRSEERAILLEDFAQVCEGVFLYTDDGSLGKQGYVADGVRAVLDKDKNFTAILACGPKPMLRGVAEAAGEYGVPCQVSLEERMACGVGACLGCAVPMADGSMKHVCKDGPVFDAQEVDWNA